jgi:hypothetical protein
VAQLGEELRLISGAHKGEFANQTYFVTDRDATRHCKLFKGGRTGPESTAYAFALFTDGLENLLIERRDGGLAPVFVQVFQWLRTYRPEEVSAALQENLLRVFRPNSSLGDDCTLALLVRSGPAAKLPARPGVRPAVQGSIGEQALEARPVEAGECQMSSDAETASPQNEVPAELDCEIAGQWIRFRYYRLRSTGPWAFPWSGLWSSRLMLPNWCDWPRFSGKVQRLWSWLEEQRDKFWELLKKC